MKKIFLFLIAFLMISTGGIAQKYIGGAGAVNGGSAYFDVSGFNQFLPESFPEFSGDFLSIGGDGYFMYNNFVIGGNGQGLFGDNIKSGTQQASIGGGFGFFQFGYDFLHKDNLKLYPLVGIGGGGIDMVFSTIGRFSAQDIQDRNTNEEYIQSNISWGSVLFDLGIGFDYFPEDDGKSSPRIGVRTGYILSPSKNDFTYAGGIITEAESYSFNGFYFRIVIGGGGFSKVE